MKVNIVPGVLCAGLRGRKQIPSIAGGFQGFKKAADVVVEGH
jgi:hypothetical protein